MQARRIGTVTAALALTLGLATCGGDSAPPPAPEPPTVTSISVSPSSAAIEVGETVQLSVSARRSDGSQTTPSASWSSSDVSVASVNGSGLVTGEGAGSATITASASGFNATATITVTAPPPPPPVPAAVVISPDTATVEANGTVTFTASVTDSAGAVIPGEPMAWAVADTTVATVDPASGDTVVATGRAAGTTTVEASSGTLSASALLQVLPLPVLSVAVTPADTTLITGDTIQYAAVISTSEGEVQDRSVSWSSSDTTVLTVSGAGVAGAVAPGSAIVIAVSEGVADTATVTVEAPAPPPPASIQLSADTVSLETGETAVVVATVLDSLGNLVEGETVQWTTLNFLVADVDPLAGDSVTITGLNPGTGGVQAAVGSITAEVAVVVTVPAVTEVQVSPADTTLEAGRSATFSATVLTSQGPVQDRLLIWSSTDPTILSVSAAGEAQALQAGSAGVVATAEGVADTANVTIVAPPPLIVEPDSVEMTQGDTVTLVATVRDPQGNVLVDQGVAWLDLGVNTVQLESFAGDEIRIIGDQPGTTTVRASLGDTLSFDVFVQVDPAPVTSVTLSPADTTITELDEVVITAAVANDFGDDLSTEVNWSVSPAGLLGVEELGRELAIFGAEPGTVQIIAEAGGVADTTTLTVDSAAVASVFIEEFPDLAVTPFQERDSLFLSVEVLDGLNQPLERDVTWTVSDTNIADFVFLSASGRTATLETYEPAIIQLIAEAGGVADTLSVDIEGRSIASVEIVDSEGFSAAFPTVNINREQDLFIEVRSFDGLLLSRDVQLSLSDNSRPDSQGPRVISRVEEDNSNRFRRRRRIRGGQAGSAFGDVAGTSAPPVEINLTVIGPDSIRPMVLSGADTLRISDGAGGTTPFLNDTIAVGGFPVLAELAITANAGDTITLDADSFDEFGNQGSQSYFWQTADSAFVELVGEADVVGFEEGLTRAFIGPTAQFIVRTPFTEPRAITLRNLGTQSIPVTVVLVPPS